MQHCDRNSKSLQEYLESHGICKHKLIENADPSTLNRMYDLLSNDPHRQQIK